MLFHCVKGIYSAFTQTSYLSYTALAQLLSATLNSGWVGQSCMLQMTILGISALIVKTSECWSPLKPGHMILNYASVNKKMWSNDRKLAKTRQIHSRWWNAELAELIHVIRKNVHSALAFLASSISLNTFFFSLRSYTRHNQYSQYYKWTLLLHIVNPSDLLFLQVCVLTGTSGIRQNQWTTHVKPCSKLMTGSAFHRWPDNEGVTLKKLDIGTQFKHNHVFPIANV